MITRVLALGAMLALGVAAAPPAQSAQSVPGDAVSGATAVHWNRHRPPPRHWYRPPPRYWHAPPRASHWRPPPPRPWGYHDRHPRPYWRY